MMDIKDLLKKIDSIQTGNVELFKGLKHCYHECGLCIPSIAITIIHNSIIWSGELEEELRELRTILEKEFELREKRRRYSHA